MRTSTVLIAVCWLVLGVFFLLLETADISLEFTQFSWAETVRGAFIIIACVGGGSLLLARKTLGWWIIAMLNVGGIAWSILMLAGIFGHIANLNDRDMCYLPLAFVGACCVGIAALLLDKPSKWRVRADS